MLTPIKVGGHISSQDSSLDHVCISTFQSHTFKNTSLGNAQPPVSSPGAGLGRLFELIFRVESDRLRKIANWTACQKMMSDMCNFLEALNDFPQEVQSLPMAAVQKAQVGQLYGLLIPCMICLFTLISPITKCPSIQPELLSLRQEIIDAMAPDYTPEQLKKTSIVAELLCKWSQAAMLLHRASWRPERAGGAVRPLQVFQVLRMNPRGHPRKVGPVQRLGGFPRPGIYIPCSSSNTQ